MRSRLTLICIWTLVVLLLSGCTVMGPKVNENIDSKEWKLLLESGSKTKVVIYHDIDDPEFEKWLEKRYVPAIKETYGLSCEIKYRSFNEYFEKLNQEKLTETSIGTVDLLMFKHSYFPKLMSQKLLYGPYVNKLDNHFNYQNLEDLENIYCNGIKNNNYAALFGRDQLILQFDEDVMSEAPTTLDDLRKYLITTNRKFTYIDPSIKTGRDFINSVFATNIGYEKLLQIKNKQELKTKAAGAIAYLNSIEPYMLGELPKSQEELDGMFVKGQTNFGMTETLDHTSKSSRIDGIPAGAKAFTVNPGTTGSAYYAVIPWNAPNKAGAMLAVNVLLSPEVQATKYKPSEWGNLPGIDSNMLEGEVQKNFRKVSLKRNDLKEDVLLKSRIPEVPDAISNMIYEVWMEEVKLK